MTVAILPEKSGDEAAITALVESAFKGQEHSDGTEAGTIERLRSEREPMLSLVALDDDEAIIGHVAFSPVSINDRSTGWFGLGPLSVAPERQREGIGAALVREGLAQLITQGARGCVVLGDPEYYSRFGFKHDPQLSFPGVPPQYFQCVVWAGDPPSGEVRYSAAFG